MNLRIAALAAVLLLPAFSNRTAVADPAGPVLSVANHSAVCVRFQAVSIEPGVSTANGTDRFDRRAGSYFDTRGHEQQVGALRTLSAAPGGTVVFADVAGARLRLTAHAHVSAACGSPATSRAFPPYESRSLREHVAFDGARFVRL